MQCDQDVLPLLFDISDDVHDGLQDSAVVEEHVGEKCAHDVQSPIAEETEVARASDIITSSSDAISGSHGGGTQELHYHGLNYEAGNLQDKEYGSQQPLVVLAQDDGENAEVRAGCLTAECYIAGSSDDRCDPLTSERSSLDCISPPARGGRCGRGDTASTSSGGKSSLRDAVREATEWDERSRSRGASAEAEEDDEGCASVASDSEDELDEDEFERLASINTWSGRLTAVEAVLAGKGLSEATLLAVEMTGECLQFRRVADKSDVGVCGVHARVTDSNDRVVFDASGRSFTGSDKEARRRAYGRVLDHVVSSFIQEMIQAFQPKEGHHGQHDGLTEADLRRHLCDRRRDIQQQVRDSQRRARRRSLALE